MRADAAVREAFARIPLPQVQVNYIPPELAAPAGHVGADGGFLKPVPDGGQEREAMHPLSCQVSFVDDALCCSWTFSGEAREEEAMRDHLRRCVEALSALIGALAQPDVRSARPTSRSAPADCEAL